MSTLVHQYSSGFGTLRIAEGVTCCGRVFIICNHPNAVHWSRTWETRLVRSYNFYWNRPSFWTDFHSSEFKTLAPCRRQRLDPHSKVWLLAWHSGWFRTQQMLCPRDGKVDRNPKGSNDTVRNPLRNCQETPTKRAYIVKLVYNYTGELRFMVHISVVNRFYKPFFFTTGYNRVRTLMQHRLTSYRAEILVITNTRPRCLAVEHSLSCWSICVICRSMYEIVPVSRYGQL